MTLDFRIDEVKASFYGTTAEKLVLLVPLLNEEESTRRTTFVNALTNNGYGVLRFKFPKIYVDNLIGNELFERVRILEKIFSYVNYVKYRSPKVKELALIGGSLTGNLALSALAKHPNKEVFDSVAVYAPYSYSEASAQVKQGSLQQILDKLGIPEELLAQQKHIEITDMSTLPKKINYLFVVGREDPLVNKVLTNKVYQRLKNSVGGLVYLSVLDAKKHNYVSPKVGTESFNTLMEWFQLTLK